MAFQIQGNVPRGNHLEEYLALAARERAQVRHELGWRERLGHVIVGARIEPADLVGHGVARGQEQHGRVHASASQVRHDGESVHLRQHHVEDDDVVDAAFRIIEPRLPVVHGVGVVAAFLEDAAKCLGKAYIIFDYENLHSAPLSRSVLS